MTRFEGGILRGLDEGALGVLFDVGTRERVGPGTPLVREGERGLDVYLVLEGACRVDVRGHPIATLGPGDLFGEIGALTGGPRTATVESAEPCDLLRLTPDALASAMARSGALTQHLLLTMASRSRSMTTREGAARSEHRELARLEHAMLPAADALAESARFRHEVHWRPYSYASGDYCDILDLGGERYMVAMGDVLGHGASTSLTIGTARGQMRELAEAELAPAQILPRLDRHLVRHGPPGLHVTLVLSRVDGQTGTVETAAAGHPPPFLARGGSVEALALRPGPLLGYGLAAGDHPSRSVDLESGDVLLYFTDGVTEIRTGTHDGLLGEEGLADLLGAACAARRSPADGVMEDLVRRLDALPGLRPAEDDAAMLALRVVA